EAALDAAETAVRLLPNNPYVEVIAVKARLAAALAYDLAGEEQKAAAHLDAASHLADALSGQPPSSPVIRARFAVADSSDGVTPPLRLPEQLLFPARADSLDVANLEVVVLWRRGRLEQARTRLAPLGLAHHNTPQLRVALALEEANGRPAARA